MKVSRKNSDTGEYERIETSMLGVLRFLVFRNASNERVAYVMIVIWRAVVAATVVTVGQWAYASGLAWPAKEADLKLIAAELKADREERKAERLEQLDLKIFELRRAYCAEKAEVVKAQYAERVNELARRYYAATKQWPRVPRCDET